MQAIYDIDEESVESLIADEDSLNLCPVIYQIISNNFHEDVSQQPFSSEDEEESNEETLEQVEYPEPSPERVEVIKEAPAQEYVNIFTEFSPIQQNLPKLQEDNTTKYDDSFSSGCSEDEEDILSQRNLFLGPLEEEVVLVETHLPNTPNQEKGDCNVNSHTVDAVIETV